MINVNVDEYMSHATQHISVPVVGLIELHLLALQYSTKMFSKFYNHKVSSTTLLLFESFLFLVIGNILVNKLPAHKLLDDFLKIAVNN